MIPARHAFDRQRDDNLLCGLAFHNRTHLRGFLDAILGVPGEQLMADRNHAFTVVAEVRVALDPHSAQGVVIVARVDEKGRSRVACDVDHFLRLPKGKELDPAGHEDVAHRGEMWKSPRPDRRKDSRALRAQELERLLSAHRYLEPRHDRSANPW